MRSGGEGASVKPRSTKSTPEKAQSIAELRTDPSNLRVHNPRNIGMLVDSLHSVGAARSVVIDEENTILAGNGVIEAAAEAGLTKLHIVDTDGDTIVAVRRTGLTPEQKQKLAIYDNRSNELSGWDADALLALEQSGHDLSAYFYPEEIESLAGQADQQHAANEDKGGVEEIDVSEIHDSFWISIQGPLPEQAQVLQALRAATAGIAGVSVELGTIENAAITV